MVDTLIVDDTPETRIVLSLLVEHAGGRVLGAVGSAREALLWLEAQSVDLVLTDFQMPGMSGDVLAAKIREAWPATRVALISVLDDAALFAKSRAAGVDWLLAKPVLLETLEQVLRGAALHRSRAAARGTTVCDAGRPALEPGNANRGPLV